MRLLLDTCVLLWIVRNDPSLPGRVRAIIEHRDAELLASSVSAWEIAISSQ